MVVNNIYTKKKKRKACTKYKALLPKLLQLALKLSCNTFIYIIHKLDFGSVLTSDQKNCLSRFHDLLK